jgi:hypothetical protein
MQKYARARLHTRKNYVLCFYRGQSKTSFCSQTQRDEDKIFLEKVSSGYELRLVLRHTCMCVKPGVFFTIVKQIRYLFNERGYTMFKIFK